MRPADLDVADERGIASARTRRGAAAMKVLHLLASPFFSGPAESLTQLALAQRALGHEVSVAVDRSARPMQKSSPCRGCNRSSCSLRSASSCR